MCALFIGIFEFSAWILKLQRFTYYWMLVELLNLFQSVLIFIIFTCRKKILEQLGEKYQLFSSKLTCIVNYDYNNNIVSHFNVNKFSFRI